MDFAVGKYRFIELTANNHVYIIKCAPVGTFFDYAVTISIKRPWYRRNKTVLYYQYDHQCDALRYYHELTTFYKEHPEKLPLP